MQGLSDCICFVCKPDLILHLSYVQKVLHAVAVLACITEMTRSESGSESSTVENFAIVAELNARRRL